MTKQASQHTRREVLTWLASIPFLPLGAMATSAALVGCNDNNDSAVINPINPIKLKSATFTPMPAPTMVAVMATTACTSKLSITWDDGSTSDVNAIIFDGTKCVAGGTSGFLATL